MYTVRTILTTIATTENLTEALEIAENAFLNKNYVEVMEVTLTINGYYGKTIKIFNR